MKLTPADVVGRLASRRRAANQQPMHLLATPPRLCLRRLTNVSVTTALAPQTGEPNGLPARLICLTQIVATLSYTRRLSAR